MKYEAKKPVEEMTDEELQDFLDSIDPDDFEESDERVSDDEEEDIFYH